ncbi:MAG: ABC transporter ATP-binding protein [Planctomycetes bacterium]|nr:ABC transporter ATP-binding protein [Planctomycetota bacterium]
MNPPSVAAACRLVRKVYGRGETAAVALDGVDVALRSGEMVALTGPSGSGKSTLLHLLGAMDVPDAGEVEVAGRILGALDDEDASAFRNRHVGFVFQFFHLIESLTAVENVALPARLLGLAEPDANARALDLLRRVGVAQLSERFPDQLSGGQRQRVAVARALVNDPVLVLADEPTGNLDHAAGGEVLELLATLGKERDVAILVATHDPLVTRRADREIRLLDGKVVAPS